MRKIITILMLVVCILGCNQESNQEKTESKSMSTETQAIAPITNETLETAIIYEANIRQYSPEGSFEAFTKDLPELKKLGVKFIWLMPIFPISEEKRKATGDKFTSDIEDPEERKKYLGSYYAVADFRKVNPEFGDIEDVRKLIERAHELDMYVILDWVPNHTGWDHSWINSNPEFYTRNAAGEITDPLKPDGTPEGWADVADLNYDNRELREAMTQDMLYWIKEENVDGFRCDMAALVPLDFWEEAIPRLRAEKPIFMLAEAWEPQLMNDDLFDMAYGWDRHHAMTHIYRDGKNVSEWDNTFNNDQQRYKSDDMLMHFVTNHDENSWNGTVKERLGKGAEAFTALTYVAPGMPLIYSGMEYNMDHRLKFFEKDSIPKEKDSMWRLLESLGELKGSHPALNGGKEAASYKRIDCVNDRILIFEREKEGSTLTYIANFSHDTHIIPNPFEGQYVNHISKEKEIYDSNQEDITLQPWEFKILLHE